MANTKAPAKKTARSSKAERATGGVRFSPDVAAGICQRLADGESLRAICKGDDMPSESAVRQWALDDVEGFSAQYTRAREIGYDRLAEEILEIADTTKEGVKTTVKATGTEESRSDMIEHRRLQVDTRKWLLAKMLPKRYGDKLAIGGDAEAPPIRTESTVTVTAEEAYKRMLNGE